TAGADRSPGAGAADHGAARTPGGAGRRFDGGAAGQPAAGGTGRAGAGPPVLTGPGLDPDAARLWRPGRLPPMLARRVEEPFDSPGFLFEIKWDGYRCLAFVGDVVFLQSRGGLDMSPWFPELAAALRALGEVPALLDGEVVAWRDGRPDFAALQRRARLRRPEAIRAAAARDPVSLIAFDLPVAGGRDLTRLPCEERRGQLHRIVAPAATAGRVTCSEAVIARGRSLYEAARRVGLEGIVAKRRASRYRPGERSRDWLKIP